MRASAVPLGAYGITINCLCPGVVDTPLIGGVGRMMAEAGYQLIPPSDIADTLVRIVRGGGSGEAWVCLPWEEPAPFEFGRRTSCRPPEGGHRPAGPVAGGAGADHRRPAVARRRSRPPIATTRAHALGHGPGPRRCGEVVR